jgi:hypothetical protein
MEETSNEQRIVVGEYLGKCPFEGPGKRLEDKSVLDT